jgi:hypothetical protein
VSELAPRERRGASCRLLLSFGLLPLICKLDGAVALPSLAFSSSSPVGCVGSARLCSVEGGDERKRMGTARAPPLSLLSSLIFGTQKFPRIIEFVRELYKL